MKEAILHYIWQNKQFPMIDLRTTDREPVEIINVGNHNQDAGPDFFNAKIKIGDTLWAGNIEIHSCSSNWNKHKHQFDKAYDNVILHVVEKSDADTFRSNGSKIPQLEIQVPERIRNNYEYLLKNKNRIACEDKINLVPDIFIESWKNTLLSERLLQKTQNILQLLEDTKQHWEECFYIILARSFGFGTNSQAFEMLARSLPLNILGKHKNNILQIEALLFGQAGLIPEEPADEYSKQLKKEYLFLRSKYNLQTSLDKSHWKLLRLRPANFPTIRIAQFAAIIHSSSKLFSKILENPEIDYLQSLFRSKVSGYWLRHYTFESEQGTSISKTLGAQSINILLINTVLPFIFSYGHVKNNQDYKDRAIQLLEKIPVEKNTIISFWQGLGIKTTSAYDSQALLQLKKLYCDEKKCLYCRIGHKVLTINH